MALVGVPFTLLWNANSESDLAGYKLYYGQVSGTYTGPGSPLDVGNVTTTTFSTNTPGQWFFVVTAYNSSAQESTYSNEIEMDVYVPLPASQAQRGIFVMRHR